MILCILFYPYDGEQAWVSYVDLGKLGKSSDANDQLVYTTAHNALRDPDGIGSMPFSDFPDNLSGQVTLPCKIDQKVTIYLET